VIFAAVLVVLAVASVITLLVRRRGRSPSIGAAAISTRQHRPRGASWMSPLTFPGLIGYWALPFGSYWTQAHLVTRRVWQDCQLVLVTKANDDVVLDCLVPPSTTAGARSRACVPVTLRTHQLPQYQSSSDALRALEGWVGTDSFVDIEVDGDAGTELVRIFVAERLVTLELLRAT
jgi:hypothetical protein